MFESLKNSREFSFVYHHGKSYANKFLVMYMVENHQGKNRLGISVSKKVGNSVVRHRLTRLIRESFRLHQGDFFDEPERTRDIVVIARAAAKGRDYAEIESACIHLAGLHRYLRAGQKG